MGEFFSGPKVGIVLVAYNNPGHLELCIHSIRAGSHKNVEIIVIDNSTRLAENPATGENVHYHKTGDNIGFCAATNLGIAMSRELRTDYTWILNFDTVLSENTLERLLAAAASLSNPGIVGAKIFYLSEPNRLWYAGGWLSRWEGVGKHFGHGEIDAGRYDVSREVTYVTGCCMLVPTAVLARIGGLKSELFMYLDDAEFCLRVQEAGFSLFYESSATLYHAVGPGAQKKSYPDYYLYFSIRNKPYITDRFAYRLYLRCYALLLTLSKLGFYGFSSGVPNRGPKLRAVLLGYLDSFTLKPVYRKRFPSLFQANEDGDSDVA